jgi:hypothetical protein
MTDGSERARKAWKTRRIKDAWSKAHAAEAASEAALKADFEKRGWHVAFFEGGTTGAPRTGIIDAIAYRLGRKNPDLLDLRLIQLKGGKAGVTASLKTAATGVTVNWLIAAFDGEALQFLSDEPEIA